MSELEKYQVQVFGASVDPMERNKRFAEKNGYHFVLLSDPDKGYAKALGVLNDAGTAAQRWTFIIDDKGIIRQIDKKVSPASHGKDLAKELEALGIPKK